MRKNLLRGLAVTGAAAALSVGLVTSANAATVTGGGAITGTASSISFTASSIGMSCGTVAFSGTSYTGTGLTKIADLSSSTWSNCLGPLSLPMTVTQSGTWAVNATSVSGGVATGSVTGISVHVQDTSTGGGICKFDVSGSAPATFTNSTQILGVTASGLTVSGVSGCFGLLSGSSTAAFSGSFAVTNPATGAAWPITVS